MSELLKQAIEKAKECLYQDTAMALDIICEDLERNNGLEARFSGRSIYINGVRVASIKTCLEAPQTVGIYDYKILA